MEFKMKKKECIKRKRSENWSEEDKMLLKELIKQRVSQIENKNTDFNTNQMKKKSWQEVEESFNELCVGGKRNLTQLKTQWAATKIMARKQISEQQKEIFKTGGGSQPPAPPINSNDISVWLPNEFVTDTNQFDSDYILDELDIEIIEEEQKIVTESIDDKHELDTSMKDEIKLTPNPKKKLPKNKSSTDESIRKVAEVEINCKEELHKIQMEVEKKKLRLLDKEYDMVAIDEELKKLKIDAERKRLRNLDMEYDMLHAKKISYENKLLDIRK